MARNKSQKKNKKKKPPKRRKPVSTLPTTLDQKLSRVRPRAYPEELAEDRAVFDDRTKVKLPADMIVQIEKVRTALQLVEHHKDDAAEAALADIPRRSPISEWRLLVRGLACWYRGEKDAASEAFSRLDADRRPARIAETLLHADRLADAGPTPAEQESNLDPLLISGANFVHRIRTARRALAEATTELNKVERFPKEFRELDLSPEFPGPVKMQWIMEFCTQNQRHDPQLTDAIVLNMLHHVGQTPLAPMMDQFATAVTGPPHDPANHLRLCLYYGRFQDGGEEVRTYRKKYIISLATNPNVSKPVAKAMEAELHLAAAEEAKDVGGSMDWSPFRFSPEPDVREIKSHYEAAIKAYPSHSDAYQQYIAWIRSRLDQRYIKASELKKIEAQLPAVMKQWATGCPDAIEPRLYLVDHYLEEEKLELAAPHVEFLAGSRNVDLRVRSTQWRWHMLEAMRLCRRKTWLGGVEEQLTEAEKIWPVWLSNDWLPYLYAALELRRGDTDAYEKRRAAIRQSWPADDAENREFADAAMLLGAAQRMRVPAPDLKPLRQPIDEAAKNPAGLSNLSLLRAGHFFLEMHRCDFLYPAFRMHGGKFADELVKRLKEDAIGADEEIKDRDFWHAMFWLAHQRSFVRNNDITIPDLLERLDEPVKVGAIRVQTDVTSQGGYLERETTMVLGTLEQAIPSETDVYLKYWYKTILEKARQRAARMQQGFGGGMFQRFAAMMGQDEDEFDDEDDDFDPTCDCEHCTRVRNRLGIPHPS